MKIKNYLLSTKFPFLSASILTVIFSGIWCWNYQDQINFLFFFLSILLVILFHFSANTTNYYFILNKNDKFINPSVRENKNKVKKLYSKKLFLFLSIFFIFISLIILEYFYFIGKKYIFLFGISGILLGMFYSTPPFSFQSKGLGELTILIAFGPLLTLGTCYTLIGIFNFNIFLLGLPFGISAMLIIWINEFGLCR